MEGQAMTICQYIRHPHIASRLADPPVNMLDRLPRGTAFNRFSTCRGASPPRMSC
jgi:hypothetical protein